MKDDKKIRSQKEEKKGIANRLEQKEKAPASEKQKAVTSWSGVLHSGRSPRKASDHTRNRSFGIPFLHCQSNLDRPEML